MKKCKTTDSRLDLTPSSRSYMDTCCLSMQCVSRTCGRQICDQQLDRLFFFQRLGKIMSTRQFIVIVSPEEISNWYKCKIIKTEMRKSGDCWLNLATSLSPSDIVNFPDLCVKHMLKKCSCACVLFLVLPSHVDGILNYCVVYTSW